MQATLDIYLDGTLTPAKRDRKLAALLTHVKNVAEGRLPCPDCGDEGPHDDNGATRRSELSYCCRACGMHFDAEEG